MNILPREPKLVKNVDYLEEATQRGRLAWPVVAGTRPSAREYEALFKKLIIKHGDYY